MNVAILSFHRLGGSGIIAHEISQELAKRYNHKIHFVGLQPPYRMDSIYNEYSSKIFFHKVTVKKYDVFDFQPYVMTLASQLSELIIKYDIDIIHSHYAIPHALAANLAKQIAKRPQVRTIVTLHGTDITIIGSHSSMKAITRYSILESDHIVAVSSYLRRMTETLMDISDQKIHMIPNFINPSSLPPDRKDPERYVGVGKHKFILHSSNLRAVKAPVDVVKIYGEMLTLDRSTGGAAGLTNSTLGITGEGPLLGEMKETARRLGIEKQVKFFGQRKDIYEYLTTASLFLLPSRDPGEAFGLAGLEAMGCGVPVIARRVGGIVEVIDHEKTGFLFNGDDLSEAAAYGVMLLSDADLYCRMSQQATVAAREKFPLDDIIQQYQALYESRLEPSVLTYPS